MENTRLREAASTSVNVTVGRRSREYLTDREVERLIEAAKENRSGHRERHGHLGCLPPWPQSLGAGGVALGRHRPHHRALALRRAKAGDASVHPISARESRALRKLQREAPTSPYVFISERRAPLSAAGWWPGQAWPRNSPFSFIPTCCGTHAASSSPTTATTLAPSKPISATARSCPRSAIEAVSKWLSGAQLMEQRFGLLGSSQQRAAVATARASRQFSAADAGQICSAACAARNVSASACSRLVRLKKAFSPTAAIEVRMMPSPKIGFS